MTEDPYSLDRFSDLSHRDRIAAIAWIKHTLLLATPDHCYKGTSYGLKHVLQSDLGLYLYSGAFQGAMLECGIPTTTPIEQDKEYNVAVYSLTNAERAELLRLIERLAIELKPDFRPEDVPDAPVSFRRWLFRHRHRNTALGRIANDVMCDEEFPNAASLADCLSRLGMSNACSDSVTALRGAWNAYSKRLNKVGQVD